MKTTQEIMKLLEGLLEQILGEIPTWYNKLLKQYNNAIDVNKPMWKKDVTKTLNHVEAVLWGILPPEIYY